MPGRTPYEAYSAFVTPLANALSCVARVKILCSAGGKTSLGRVHRLYLGGNEAGDHVKLAGDVRLELRARMRYEIIEDERKDYGPYRIRTRAYEYSLRQQNGQAVLEYHWHPDGVSHEVRPHIHLGSTQLRPEAVLTNKDHTLSGRMTLESVIRQAINYGVEPLHDDWDDRLTGAETPHLLYRSWHANPSAEQRT